MTDLTPLDRAHAAMTAQPEDDAARLRFFERLAESELFLLLGQEPDGDTVDPRIFDTEEGPFVLAFDREERLASFADGIAPYAALSGRLLSQLLSGRSLGLALNPDVAPSAILLGADAMAWLAETLANGPQERDARPRELLAPTGLPDRLIEGLDAKFALMTGRARAAYLANVIYDTGARGHLLAFVDADPGAQTALARAVNEVLVFSGLDAAELDIVFLRAADAISGRLARVALRFDLPQHDAPPDRPAPGSDPDRPPRLR